MAEEIKTYLSKLMKTVTGLYAILVTDRDGVPVVKVSSEQAPELALRQDFLCTFSAGTEQANKIGFKKNNAVVCMYQNYQVVQVNCHPLTVTYIAESDTNTGLLLSLKEDMKDILNDISSVVITS
ncbi:ragulator complex protein LAMTOR3-B-like isoform X1 [Pecten maximus]|uniref:ragulator complex protein LAMTOR3-B-like isoform X1 n=2 Tax=Pecten maximus TaxID=6579 RepID=UPI001458E676|nr:ragulator complex protein LAMTOR3-B-like isoform X1 [Pecten maximus]